MEEFLTIPEFCASYRLGRTTAYKLIAAGEIEAVKVGAGTRIVASTARDWAARLPSLRGEPRQSPPDDGEPSDAEDEDA